MRASSGLSAYERWIEENVPDRDVPGLCHHYARLLQEAFPELIHVYGIYRDLETDEDEYHGWCETANGEIIDPTDQQFNPGGEYFPMSIVLYVDDSDELIHLPYGDSADVEIRRRFCAQKARLWRAQKGVAL